MKLPFIATLLAFSASAHAVLIEGLSGLVVVNETGIGQVSLAVDVAPEVDAMGGMTGFVFSFNNFMANNPSAPMGWDVVEMSESNWNNGFSLTAAGLLSTDYGTFNDLFGTFDNRAYYYFDRNWYDTTSASHAVTSTNDASTGFGLFSYFAIDTSSEFIAIAPSGALIDGSVVPEPASISFLGGLAALALARRRQSGFTAR